MFYKNFGLKQEESNLPLEEDLGDEIRLATKQLRELAQRLDQGFDKIESDKRFKLKELGEANKKEMAELQGKLEEKEELLQKKQEEISLLFDKVNQLTKSLEEEQQGASMALESAKEIAKKELEEEKARLEGIISEKEALATAKESLILSLTAEKLELESKLKGLEDENALEELEKRVKELEREIEDRDLLLANKDGVIESLGASNSELGERIKLLQEENQLGEIEKSYGEKIAKLESLSQSKDLQLATKDSEISSLRSKNNELNENLNKLIGENWDLKERVAGFILANADCEAHIEPSASDADLEAILDAPKKPKSNKKICKSCGAELSPGVIFCTSCGQKQ